MQSDRPFEKESDQSNQKHQSITKHTKGKRYACDECDSSFDRPCHLSKHKNTVHREIRCDQCNKSFTHLSNLVNHKKFVHQKIRPFSCQQCDQGFVSAVDLKRHSFTHTGNGFTYCTTYANKCSMFLSISSCICCSTNFVLQNIQNSHLILYTHIR